MLLLAPWHCHTSWSYISELWNVPNKTNPRYPWDKKKKKLIQGEPWASIIGFVFMNFFATPLWQGLHAQLS